jgi:hypothetical protein
LFKNTITAGTPTEIVAGPSAEASVGGLVISLRVPVPAVRIPSQLAPVLSQVLRQIPTKCVYEVAPPQAPHVPLCFGPGVVPGGGNRVALTLAIARASAFATGATFEIPISGPGSVPQRNAITTGVLGEQFGQQDIAADVGESVPAADRPTPAVGAPAPVVPVGLVARLPSSLLAVLGALLLLLAVGLALGPSLRHAGPR